MVDLKVIDVVIIVGCCVNFVVWIVFVLEIGWLVYMFYVVLVLIEEMIEICCNE